MPSRIVEIVCAAVLAACGAAPVLAQGAGPVFDPAQLPAFRGTVKRYTLTPRGDIDGLVLTDGTEVNLPPHLTPEIAFAIRPGDAVTIHGLRARALPLVAATSVRNEATGQVVVDRGPRHGQRDDGERTLSGVVEAVLRGPRGEVNGVMLEDGTTIRLPPDDDPGPAAAGPSLAAGQRITARGVLLQTLLGSVLDATAIGPEEGDLSEVRRPPGRPPDRGPPPPGPPRP
jgi:hypothetical protein